METRTHTTARQHIEGARSQFTRLRELRAQATGAYTNDVVPIATSIALVAHSIETALKAADATNRDGSLDYTVLNNSGKRRSSSDIRREITEAVSVGRMMALTGNPDGMGTLEELITICSNERYQSKSRHKGRLIDEKLLYRSGKPPKIVQEIILNGTVRIKDGAIKIGAPVLDAKTHTSGSSRWQDAAGSRPHGGRSGR